MRSVRAGWILGMVVCLALRGGMLSPALAQDASAQNSAAADGRGGDYLTRIKPLLRERCYACHGALKQQAGLRLDTVEAMLRGGDSGPVVARGKAAESLLLERVGAKDVFERMPPEFEGEPLSAEQIALLRNWIAAGAPAPDDEQPEPDPRGHWAFQPIERPPVPPVRRGGWGRNPIDAFIAGRHEQLELEPQPEASRLMLLRRLSLDLIGVPPTAEEIAAFQSDESPDWYERAVERLLDDPRHGERWARHWMDVWRYSDWWGLGAQLRNSQRHIWHWRDWIVQSLNADTPYDEMVRLMLAADELHPNDLDKLRAGGYLARNYILFNRDQWMDETVEHVAKGFLGLTMNCAKCHDHKYDPISQTDYYALRAFFEPYHVRLDVRPGETDLARDGVPRAFDGVLDAPTYLFVRGDENKPDKSAAIAPGLPALLEFAPLTIEPVDLPVEAWQPERRPWIADAYRDAAKSQIAAAEAKVAAAKKKLAEAERKEEELAAQLNAADGGRENQSASDGPAIVDTFETLDAQRWKLFGGDWSHEPGRIEQKRDGAARAALRLKQPVPRDFDVSVRLTILGGSRFRSVGVGFDVTQDDPTATPAADDSEQHVYISAYAQGPKVQAAWRRGAKWQYPREAAAARPVELNRQYTLRIQVRDSLVNASLDGEPAIAWHSPLPRRDGSLQITTFDALAVFHEVTVAPLDPDAKLREPSGQQPNLETPAGAAQAVAQARQELKIAELTLAAAQAELAGVERRAAAMQWSWKRMDEAAAASDATTDPESTGAESTDAEPADSEGIDLHPSPAHAAAQSERELAAARARLALAEAELQLDRAADDKREAVEKQVASARAALEKALQQIEEPSDQFTPFAGAQWTPTRFMNSGRDDPAVTFPPRSTGRRTALAEWITDRRNPLTARVAVNHLWTRHFGTPLVPTVFDFGRNGSPPTHPELLDWLAAELIDSGWSMKPVHRLIVQSAVYRMSSSTAGAEQNLARDPDNVFYWRRTPQRIESQAVRDSILALAGALDLAQGGPSVPPAAQAESKRRSLYFFHSNNERNQFLTMFDEALVRECYRRDQSIVPQQALALTNSRLVLDAAPQVAERLTRELEINNGPAGDEAFIKLAFAVVLGAEPNEQETAASVQALAAWRKLPDAPENDADRFARANLIWVLLNHNDFVTLR